MRRYDQVNGQGINRPLFSLIILLLTVLFGCEGSRADEAPRRVLILHSYNYTFPSTTAVTEALRKGLGRFPGRLEIEADFLDLARRSDAAHALAMANFLREKYANVRFDAVVVVGVAGIPFLLKYRDSIAPGAPVVLSEVSRSTFDAMQLPADITAVINDFKPEKTLELAEALQPGARRLVVWPGTPATRDSCLWTQIIGDCR